MKTHKPKLPTAPKHLAVSTRRWWAKVVQEFELDDHHLHLLKLACEALDRGEKARQVLRQKGFSYKDRFKQERPRLEIAIQRDSAILFARLLRELDLDVDPPASDAKRPPQLRRYG